MTTQERLSPLPVVLVASLEPVAVEGCDVCGALVEQREEARGLSHLDVVARCNAELREHPHAKT
jgi:hypothetical protein